MTHPLLPPGVRGTPSCDLYTDMSDPFSFGLRPDQDFLLTALHPEDEQAAETMNVWVYDGPRNTGFNIHAQMHAGEMRAPVTIFVPDGRILRIRTDDPARFGDPARPHTRHIQYECVRPYRHWRYAITDMPVWMTNHDALTAGAIADEAPTTTVSLRAEAITLNPAWVQGTLLREAHDALAAGQATWIAAHTRKGLSSEAFRFEQTILCEGEIIFEGQVYPFKGCGLRGHVRGTRIMGGMNSGHSWISGATPGGTAFGLLSFPRDGGGFHLNEAFVFKGGILYPSRIQFAPPMSYDWREPGYTIELVNDQLGLTRITGHDDRLFWWSMPAWGSGQPPRWGVDPAAPMVMRQALATFQIDGETAYGMNERSGPRP
ncbi:MAG: hypothetical protein ABW128_08840 [Rhizorhabdus sp.]